MMARISTETMMKMEHFHDFYFLQAIEAAVKMEIAQNPDLEFQKPVEKFLDDLDKTVDRLIPNMALRTFLYLYAASLGEARHAKDTVARDRFVSAQVKQGRASWFSMALEYRPTKQNLKTLYEIFAQDWRAGYGGEAWEKIVEALMEYETTPPAAWLDHVVDLEHNNGTAFSKPEGEDVLKFSVYYPERFSCFLDYKFEGDILRKGPNFTSYLAVSQKVYALLTRYSFVFKKPEVKHVKAELDTLTEYLVEWGDSVLSVEEKWHDWASVGEDNKPNIKVLMNEAGFFDFYPGYYTKEKFLEKIERCKTRMLASLHEKFATAEFKILIGKKVKAYIKRNINKCKIDKAPKTYQLLPCKVKSYKFGKGVLQFDFPYQDGYGKQTENGFEVEVAMFATKEPSHDAYITKHSGEVALFMTNQYLFVNSPVLEALLD